MEMERKLKRRKIWKDFIKLKGTLGIKFREKVSDGIEKAKLRNEMLLSLFRTSANNVRSAIEEKVNTVRRSRE
jgi:hypothetical protein